MKEKFLKQARHEYSLEKRLKILPFLGLIFLGILPAGLFFLSRWFDHQFDLTPLAFGIINLILGCIFIAIGILLGLWSNYVQFTAGRGTPVPIMATQQLLTQKPYSYCRNPMALGAIVLYLGVAILIGSLSALGLVLLFAIVLLLYIKFVEEKEMELRFGDAYREYRKQTPFIIPRFRVGK